LTGQRGGAPSVDVIRRVWDTFQKEGALASIDELLEHCTPDVEATPYAAGGRVMRGADSIRDFLRESTAAGMTIHARPRDFRVEDESVVVDGSIRVGHPDGSFAETKVRWYYHFRGPLIDAMGWTPRAGS
jgi:hypothetical protein